MKKEIKKVLGLLLVAAALLVQAEPALHAQYSAPKDAGTALAFDNPSFIGVKPTWTNDSTSPVQLYTGRGLLYAACSSGGVANAYSLAFDTSVRTTVTILSSLYLMTPAVFATATTPFYGGAGCWVPPWPVQFENGLVGVNTAAGFRTMFYYRPNGKNP